jgi:predicted nucleic acid-binding Zn finger protein
VAVKFAVEATVVSVGGRFAAEFGNTNSVNLSNHKRRRMSLLLGEDNRYSVKAGYCFPSTKFLSEIVVYLGGVSCHFFCLGILTLFLSKLFSLTKFIKFTFLSEYRYSVKAGYLGTSFCQN